MVTIKCENKWDRLIMNKSLSGKQTIFRSNSVKESSLIWQQETPMGNKLLCPNKKATKTIPKETYKLKTPYG
jgi:hypothetical protein